MPAIFYLAFQKGDNCCKDGAFTGQVALCPSHRLRVFWRCHDNAGVAAAKRRSMQSESGRNEQHLGPFSLARNRRRWHEFDPIFFFFFPSECHAADPVNRRISLLSLVSLESSSCGPAAFTLFSAFPFDARNSSRQTRHFPTKYSGPPHPLSALSPSAHSLSLPFT